MATDHFDAISASLAENTLRNSIELGFANAEANRPHIGDTIRSLLAKADGRPCLVISAGPSLRRRQSLERLKDALSRFVVVAVDGALGHCLRTGVVPNYVVSVDPHRERIVRWFGDDQLSAEKLAADDYFRRQDLDTYLNDAEIAKNQELLDLVNRHGAAMAAVLATSASDAVRRRCQDAGMKIYWWNPIYDDVSDPASFTRKLYASNRVACMNAGGNCGTAATIFAARILKAPQVVMVGMDFAYYADTPIQITQYYDHMRHFIRDSELQAAHRTIRNPHTGTDFYTDPAYHWYAEGFRELIRNLDGCEIVNATEGGILFGPGITWKSVDDVLLSVKE